MSFDDLNLEFEDEEDFKKKKNDAVHVDLDLVFQSQEPAAPKPRPAGPPPNGGPSNVQPLPSRPTPKAAPPPMPEFAGATAIKMAPREATRSNHDLMEHVRKVEFEAEVKVRVADFKAEFLGEVLGDMKFMEYQIGQLLSRINTKHPDTKQELMMIKKILADFTAKKRR
ncbi:MAG: hypothetical protein NDI69_02880 [Bacteriovoracaceae bacterium]|nr:hypothetical protein [Bacteriovoracaceae bacterium]